MVYRDSDKDVTALTGISSTFEKGRVHFVSLLGSYRLRKTTLFCAFCGFNKTHTSRASAHRRRVNW